MNERIKLLRKELNLTREKFGDLLGVSKIDVELLESGENNLTDQILNLICSTYNVNPDWLRTGSGDMFIIVDEDDELLLLVEELKLREINGEDVRFRKKLLLAIGNLPEDDLEKLLSAISNFPEDRLRDILRIRKNLCDEIYSEDNH